MPRIIFISNSTYPVNDSGGGNIVLYRHLKRFENEGYEIVFINSLLNSPFDSEFKEVNIRKQWWFPPLRRKWQLFLKLRTWAYSLFLSRKIKFQKNDVILAILGDYINLLALEISQRNKLPLHLIYHDDSLFNEYGKTNFLGQAVVRKIIISANAIYVVSEEMIELLKKHHATNVVQLYPIPEGGKITISSKDEHKIRLAYSGLVFQDLHLELIRWIAEQMNRVDGKLSIISSIGETFKNELLEVDGLDLLPYFKTNKELREYIGLNINVLLVFYSFKINLEHRMHTSFPSKFVEYCHYGLPVLLIAPPESTLGKWAVKNKWKTYLDELNEQKFNQILNNLNDKVFWNECKDQALTIAKTQFDPDQIHKILIDNIKAE